MTKTARRKMKKAQRKVQQSRPTPSVQRATPAPRTTPVADPFDLSPADIEAAAVSQRNAQRAAQRRGQQQVPIIGGKPADYSETLHHEGPPRHAPPARDPGRCGPVGYDTLYFEAWRAFFKADAAVYKPRHYLGISPVCMGKAELEDLLAEILEQFGDDEVQAIIDKLRT